ncbi:hypothetical protein [Desulfoluna spongiiphila]|uniref:hypothetical protein n=1 Tax=Desulfoluna spongiiphila TaxID=419481 RepID=UPI001256ADF1|nr:hypothetical protein [Desulfoluna spongiiphila]VVS91431.1 hypothetical protein DBB_9990 [Desulfoluna spongiiphila]
MINVGKKIAALILILQCCSCAYTKYSPHLTDQESEQLLSNLSRLTIKIDSTSDGDTDRYNQLFRLPIQESGIFKQFNNSDKFSDLIISNYSDSNYTHQSGFFNEALAYITFFGYVTTFEENHIYKFEIVSPKTKDSVSYGPLPYKVKTYAGWFFTPIMLSKQWYIDVKNFENKPNTASKKLWIDILSSNQEELLKLTSKLLANDRTQ